MRYCESSAKEVCSSNEEILRLICKNTLKTRPMKEVEYSPYTETPLIPDKLLIGIDFKDVFSDFEDGDFVYMACGYEAIHDREMIYNLSRYSEYELYFNGEKKEKEEYKDGTMDSEVIMRQGENLALIKVIAKNGELKAVPKTVIPESHTGYYGYSVRQFIPLEGFKKQRGVAFSRLYKKSEEVKPEMDSIEWIFPKLPLQTNTKTFDFNELCKKGNVAYAYTVFKGKIRVKHDSPLKIFANKKEVYSAIGGIAELEFKDSTDVLFKSGRGENVWGLETESDGVHSMPMTTTDEHSDLHWVWVGPFGREDEPFSHPYPPEYEITFEEPYPSIHDARVYWNFYRKDTIMVQSINSNSFGHWMYACMVGVSFLRCLADKLDMPELYDYFMKSINTICTRREYAIYENRKYGYAAIQNSSATLSNLDAIGTFGMNIAEYYLMSGSKDARRILHILSEKIENNIPRFPDGTYNRVKTMWTDDMYMSLPFLVRLGVIFDEKKYFDEVYRQIIGYYDRMFMKDQGLYSHIYYPEEEVANRIPWGRGNGWVLLALSEVLLLMPQDYEGRERILKIFQEFSNGILNWRDKKEGIWHQVINNYESYIETSGSAMFITALARGVRNGWIVDCKEDIIEAWQALTDKCVDSEGNVYGVCMGSSCSKDKSYYMKLGTVKNDDHGIGVVMGAGIEVMNLLGEVQK